MTKDVQEIREEFPLLKEVVWLASAGVGPMPRAALSAMAAANSKLYAGYDPKAWNAEDEVSERACTLIAKLLSVNPEEIALTRSTTEGLNAIACAIPWKRGDHIVITDQEYPANAVPWYHQAHLHGLEVRVVRSEAGRLPISRFAEAIDDRTRVVAISHVQFATGFRADLATLSELAHSRGALLVVDGIQSVGALAVRPRELGIDALAAGGYKWLCGPIGSGFLYVRKELCQDLVPVGLGFGEITPKEHEDIWDALTGGRPWVRDFSGLAPGAKRFSGVGLNPAVLEGLSAALEMFLKLGPEWIEARVIALSGLLIERLKRKGFQVVTPEAEKERAGIVLFRGPWDLSRKEARAELDRSLEAAGVKVSIRAGGVRVACHFFNTEEDLERLLEALP